MTCQRLRLELDASCNAEELRQVRAERDRLQTGLRRIRDIGCEEGYDFRDVDMAAIAIMALCPSAPKRDAA